MLTLLFLAALVLTYKVAYRRGARYGVRYAARYMPIVVGEKYPPA